MPMHYLNNGRYHICSQFITFIQKDASRPGLVAQLVGTSSQHAKVVSLIPGLGHKQECFFLSKNQLRENHQVASKMSIKTSFTFFLPLFLSSFLSLFPSFFFKKTLFIYFQRGREGEREREKHQCMVASYTLPTGDLACNPGLCPDWEQNQQPVALQASTQSTEP